MVEKAPDNKEKEQEIQRALYKDWGVTKESLMTFCDAVFSIAITLLALNLVLPVISDQEFDAIFLGNLANLFPKVLGFVISFFVIATYWVSLHRMFFFVKSVDKWFIWLTLTMMFFIAIMPFPTYVLGLYGNHALAAIFYASIISISSLVMYSIWRYATKGRKLVDKDLKESYVRVVSERTIFVTAVFLVSIPVAFLSPIISEWLWAVALIGFSLAKSRKR